MNVQLAYMYWLRGLSLKEANVLLQVKLRNRSLTYLPSAQTKHQKSTLDA